MSSGVQEAFFTHLKLKGLYEQYKISHRDILVDSTPPALYELYQTSRLNELKYNTYSLQAGDDSFSKTIAMKKILGFTDDDIEENEKMLTMELEKQAERDYMIEKIQEFGSREAAEKAIAKEQEQDSDDSDDF
jgi:hypothetical protein